MRSILFQTRKNVQGKLRVGSKERLTFFGQVQLSPSHSSHQVVKIRANFTHQLQVNQPLYLFVTQVFNIFIAQRAHLYDVC